MCNKTCQEYEECVLKNGEEECECKANHLRGLYGCLECQCPENSNCTLKNENGNEKTECVCPEGLFYKDQRCEECEKSCDEDEECFLIGEKEECRCKANFIKGSFGCLECLCPVDTNCTLKEDKDGNGETVCMCNEGYYLDGEICKENDDSTTILRTTEDITTSLPQSSTTGDSSTNTTNPFVTMDPTTLIFEPSTIENSTTNTPESSTLRNSISTNIPEPKTTKNSIATQTTELTSENEAAKTNSETSHTTGHKTNSVSSYQGTTSHISTAVTVTGDENITKVACSLCIEGNCSISDEKDYECRCKGSCNITQTEKNDGVISAIIGGTTASVVVIIMILGGMQYKRITRMKKNKGHYVQDVETSSNGSSECNCNASMSRDIPNVI